MYALFQILRFFRVPKDVSVKIENISNIRRFSVQSLHASTVARKDQNNHVYIRVSTNCAQYFVIFWPAMEYSPLLPTSFKFYFSNFSHWKITKFSDF